MFTISPTGATSTTALALAVFGASMVEMVEALTLVLAAGTRSWRSAFEGTAAGLGVLAAATAAVGLPLATYLPIDTLRVIVGTLLLLLGLSWLKKAVLRASGCLPMHDEDAIYARTVGDLAGSGNVVARRDPSAFMVAFKGVLLEGSEVVLIVVSLGTSAHHLGIAAASAGGAVFVVAVIGAVVARQLSAVPENSLKFVVGVMLSTFGVFWVAEGAGVRWPAGDLALPVLVAVFALSAAAMVASLRNDSQSILAPNAPAPNAPAPNAPAPNEQSEGLDPSGIEPDVRTRGSLPLLGKAWRGLMSFLVDDTPEVIVLGALVVGAAYGLRGLHVLAYVALPSIAVAGLAFSVWRARSPTVATRPTR